MSDLPVEELEYRLLYSIVVAGKSAQFAENAMRSFLAQAAGLSPFDAILMMEDEKMLGACIRAARMGNYAKLERAFREIAAAKLDLATCTPEQLEAVHGIGPKTSRFFILWTRPHAQHAALDTHVLKWLRFIGHAAPKSTPSGEKYSALEKVVLDEAAARGMTARELDSAIWDWCSTGGHLGGVWPANLQPRRVA
jgi:endonuclease III